MDDVEGNTADAHINDVTDSGVFQAVLDGYDAMYNALPNRAVFTEIWRTHAYDAAFPDEFAHIGFLTLDEGRRLLQLLRLDTGAVLVDVACGTGGPGLWAAQQTGATLIGIDPQPPASQPAASAPASRSRLGRGPVWNLRADRPPRPHCGRRDGVEAFQYAPDRRVSLAELHRILRPGGRLAIISFETDPAKAANLPVLGVDPIPDYAPLLQSAGFAVDAYEETPGWQARVYGTFDALLAATDALVADLGERAAAGVLAEAMLTIQTMPYPRRVLFVAHRLD